MSKQDNTRPNGHLEPLERALRSRAEDNRIGCRVALDTAAEFGVSASVVGKILNKLEIKIARCQLGCF